jgi:hypothetical protein
VSGACVKGAGELARTRQALRFLWTPVAVEDAHAALGSNCCDDPVRSLALITLDGLALCAWRCVEPLHVTCAAFRCLGAYAGYVHPSALIWGAEAWAWERWPEARLTIRLRRSPDVWPDAASFFVQAGWKEVGIARRSGLVLLERLPEPAAGCRRYSP